MMIRLRQKKIAELATKGERIDGRNLTDYREIEVEQGVIGIAEGSARVRLGKTEVLVGIKIEIGEPYPDTPDEGVLAVNAELVPLASPTFEPGPPDENAIELARVVDRGIRESKAIDFTKLCIQPSKKVFVVFVDLYILNYDGNLIDASALAALNALLNAKMPKYEIEEDEVKIKPGYTPLKLERHPIAITIAKINKKFIVDPRLEEERAMNTRITITFDDDENICAIQKGESGYFSPEEVLEAAEIARSKAKEIRKKLKL
ncbi:MAG: exosome complex protein Rrp42 [Candidatus Bathyarchaeota archaeon]|jgi:exosome complex component RRP42